MKTLTDTQRILLSTASQREGGSILPLPTCLKPGGGTAKALDVLLNRGLAEERETSDASAVRRIDGDLQLGLSITKAGLEAMGVELGESVAADDASPGVVTACAVPAKTSKVASVLDLLRRADGATLPELIEATGWLPHTTRAALTGIRKKGHVVERGKRDGATCYRIVVAA